MSKPYIFTASVAKIIDGDTIDVTDINLGFGIVYRGTDTVSYTHLTLPTILLV